MGIVIIRPAVFVRLITINTEDMEFARLIVRIDIGKVLDPVNELP